MSGEELALIQSGLQPASAEDQLRESVNTGNVAPAASLETTGSSIPWARFLTSRDLLAVTFSYFTYGYASWIFFSWFNIYLTQARGLNPKASALYTTLPFLAMTGCCLFGGVLNDWMARRYGLRVGRCVLGFVALLLTGTFLALGSTIHSALFASLVLAGGAGALYLSQSSYWSVTVDLAGVRSGIVSGIMNMGCQIGAALTASLTPLLASKFGWTTSFMTAAGLAALGGVAWLLVDPTRTLADSVAPAYPAGMDTQFQTAVQRRS